MGETITWTTRLAAVAGKDAKKLGEALGAETVGDLLENYPRSWVPKGSLSQLGELEEGDLLSLVGQVRSAKVHEYRDRRTGRPAYRLETLVAAADGQLRLTFFDKQQHTARWRAEQLAAGSIGMFTGKLKWFNRQWELTNPRCKMFAAEGDAEAAYAAIPELIPVYRSIGGIDTWQVADAVALALDLIEEVPDPLPEQVRGDLVDRRTALQWIHRPDSMAVLTKAKQRLKFDEAFVTQVVLAQRRHDNAGRRTTPRAGREGGLLDRFDARLPFTLTDGQRTVGETVAADLADPHPMHRLLQGEVGSGKTLVALRAMLQVVDSGGQAALLAPTEVLAQQHHRTITAMLGDLAQGGLLGGDPDGTRVALLTGSLTAAARREALLDAASGEAGIVVGTHALLQGTVSFADLGLVVVDEQHRFGVEQRAALSAKAELPPHVLVMTATPIPRTVAITVFGDLDTSTLAELPAGRAEVRTALVPAQREAWVDRAWQRIREEVGAGRQAYVVCPAIEPGEPEESDEPPSADAGEDRPLSAVEEVAPLLEQGPLQGLRLARLHGRLPADERDQVMRGFADGEIDVLIATTVIEVGVDVPNATVMVILDADRFGVSQLHQLRGRIGRGGHAGLCLLVTGAPAGSPALARLDAVASTRDGFALSEVDLRLRREGDVLGVRQSGRRSQLRLLSILDDLDVIDAAREAAAATVAQDPSLTGHPALRDAVQALADSADYLEKG